MHRAVDWKLKYTPDDGDLVELFYLPALEDAKRYDRLTGYFSASALTLAARGIEGLIRNKGRMRLIVGCTLDAPEIAAIHEGAEVRGKVTEHLRRWPLKPGDGEEADALELLAWMVANDHLDVRVAIPADTLGRPVSESALFHEKTGIIEDTNGDRIAWTGSLNETASGWQHNWETINVFTSWGPVPARLEGEEENFSDLWADRRKRARVIDVPDAVREKLLEFSPKEGLPKRLKQEPDPLVTQVKEPDAKAKLLRERVWSFIRKAPSLTPNGEMVGEETAPITPWPHQVRAFERMYHNWPPQLLIADEVGLGKTIQAGMVLRQAWLSGRARRILIMVPAAVMKQWQIELYEKFNLNWPIYAYGQLRWYSPNPERASENARRGFGSVAPRRCGDRVEPSDAASRAAEDHPGRGEEVGLGRAGRGASRAEARGGRTRGQGTERAASPYARNARARPCGRVDPADGHANAGAPRRVLGSARSAGPPAGVERESVRRVLRTVGKPRPDGRGLRDDCTAVSSGGGGWKSRGGARGPAPIIPLPAQGEEGAVSASGSVHDSPKAAWIGRTIGGIASHASPDAGETAAVTTHAHPPAPVPQRGPTGGADRRAEGEGLLR